jgi:hypothetical protein
MMIAALVCFVSSETALQQFQIVLEKEKRTMTIATVRHQSLRLLETMRWHTTSFKFVKEVGQSNST